MTDFPSSHFYCESVRNWPLDGIAKSWVIDFSCAIRTIPVENGAEDREFGSVHILIGLAIALGLLWVLTATSWGRRVLLFSVCGTIAIVVGSILVVGANNEADMRAAAIHQAAVEATAAAYERSHPPSAAVLAHRAAANAAVAELNRDFPD